MIAMFGREVKMLTKMYKWSFRIPREEDTKVCRRRADVPLQEAVGSG